ncbi:uncharacterized protein LOC113356345 isoform X1 [Papaver somniferum]|uniref:uncharacterized protein LOC113356345 isoform X1 n=1 Tax=Papaver somniferum TaxID=3469 RepID=UPI000E6F9D39|nr:uncharacterized protein LOC113356345 isoform X1 [Papaver somniferum]
MGLGFQFRRLSGIAKFLPRFSHSRIINQQARNIMSSVVPTKFQFPMPHVWVNLDQINIHKLCQIHRLSTVSEIPNQLAPDVNLITFLESTLDELQGADYCWLNKPEESKQPFDRNGTFLVLVDAFTSDSLMFGSEHTSMFETVKLLQRRHPELCIFGFQSLSSDRYVSARACIVHTIMKEYITFPILLSNKTFPEEVERPCYLIFKDFKSPLQYIGRMTEVETFSNAIEELNLVQHELLDQNLGSLKTKKADVAMELYDSSLRNLLLYFPGCISVDEDENRLFISDSNHHRIIIIAGSGKILDCIGSSPGFEDGDFESAKLLRPASLFYDAVEDCLYFVDSENHAIRKANIGSRTLETLYPNLNAGKRISSSIWSWISENLLITFFPKGREEASQSEEFDSEMLRFPWHLMKEQNNLFIINPSIQTLWIMDASSGEIKDVITGYQNIMEICGKLISEKRSLLNQITENWLPQRVDSGCLREGYPYDSLMSSVATYNNKILFCDTVGQAILELDMDSEDVSELRLSNFEILGLPYWYCYPPERVFVSGIVSQRPGVDHLQSFSVLSGRCDIEVNVQIPKDTELAAPLQEGCIWRQARGSAAEVSGSEEVATSAKKVGIAQQWFEELDNLAFSREELSEEEDKNLSNFHQDSRVVINCVVNISPGTSEVVINAVLYLKLNRNSNFSGNHQEEKAKRILEKLNPHHRVSEQQKDACVQLMLESKRDLGELVFMRPLHLRIGLAGQDCPKGDTANEIVLTDSKIEVNVSLR